MSEKVALNQVEFGIRLPSGAFTRNIFKTIKDIPAVRKRYKNKGVYMSAYRYTDAKNKSDDSLLQGHLYIDLDINDLKDPSLADDAFEKIREDGLKAVSFLSAIVGVDEDMIRIYFSGQKGLHVVVPDKVFGLQPMKELNHVFRMIALEIHRMSKYKTIDIQIYDNARLFSLPGAIHPETGRHKIPLTFDELRTLSFGEICKLAKRKRKVDYKEPRFNSKCARMFQTYVTDWEKEKLDRAKKSKTGYKQNLNFCPPCIQSLLDQPCAAGGRNNTAAVLASYFKQRGWSQDKAWKMMTDWNSAYASLHVRELETTFNSIFNGEYVYGCSTLEQIGDCQKDKCKIGQNKTNNKNGASRK